MRLIRDLQTILTVLCGLTLVLSFFGVWAWMPYLSVAFGSYFALGSAWGSIKERELDVNFLMVFAAAGAVAVDHAVDAAALLFLFSLSSTLEAFAMSRTKSAIEGLIRLRPSEAILIAEGSDKKVPVESLQVGDEVRILPYEQIPTDGVVLVGAGSVDASAMSGESHPVAVGPGSQLLSGTQNLDTMLTMTVQAVVGQTMLDKVVELVKDAQQNKASGERISAWFGQRYTILVLVAFGLSLLIRLGIGFEFGPAFYSSLILLVALSPCAVVISTPATTLSALAWAAKNGVLIRGGEFIEALGRVDTVLLDKTGTLTAGKPKLVEICVCSGVPETVGATGSICMEEDACWDGGPSMPEASLEFLQAAAIAEQYSTHPIAEAIVAAARERGLEIPEAEEQRAVSGMGVVARYGGKTISVGQRRFFEQDGKSLDPEFAVHAEELQAKGMTVAILEMNGRMAALGLRDEARSEAPAALQALRDAGVQRFVMITGDNQATAKAIASELNLSDYRGGLLPDDKERIVKEFESLGMRTMMIGDGINDAPSLARSSVGVAMGGLGSDIALNAADVVLMQDRLDRIPQVLRLGQKTNLIIKQNLYFATGIIVALTISSLFLKLPLPIAVVGHEGSTVLVILNGLRLLKGP